MAPGLDAGRPGASSGRIRFGTRAQDVLLAVASAVLALLSLTGLIAPLGDSDDGGVAQFRAPDALGVGLVLLASAGILVARSHPLPALALVDACMFALHAVGYAPPPLPAAELVVLYAVASRLRALVSVAAAIITAASIVVADLLHDVSLDDDKLVAFVLTVLMAWVVGYLVMLSRTQTLVAQENVRLLAAQQAARTQLAVREEKERLTRELHDVVAHGIGVMVALAAAARVAGRSGAGDPQQVLATVEDTGRAALAEMRALIRDRDGEDATSVPLLTDSALQALVESTQAAGLAVELTVEGTPRPLPPCVDHAAYRLVQESLTNTLRHAAAASARVSIGYRPETIDIRVHDDGHGLPRRRRTDHTDGGYGHLGLRRRVTLLGGTFQARATPEGYEVRASIPTRQERA